MLQCITIYVRPHIKSGIKNKVCRDVCYIMKLTLQFCQYKTIKLNNGEQQCQNETLDII